jgi:ATP synthase protein I
MTNSNDAAAGKPNDDNDRQRQVTKALRKDFERRRRRDSSHRAFWRWLGVLGMVGWPLAISIVGGAMLGHYLDVRWNTGIQFTLLLLTLGVAIGSLVVWRVLGEHE